MPLSEEEKNKIKEEEEYRAQVRKDIHQQIELSAPVIATKVVFRPFSKFIYPIGYIHVFADHVQINKFLSSQSIPIRNIASVKIGFMCDLTIVTNDGKKMQVTFWDFSPNAVKNAIEVAINLKY